MSAGCTTITAGLTTAGETALKPSPVMPSATLVAGLTSAAAAQLLIRVGSNAVADVAQHPARRALLKLWAPVPWMLEGAIALQLAIGDYAEAGVVALLLVRNAALGFFQEGRAQATLDALKSRLALIAAAHRDGVWTTTPAAGLVAGDVVKLSLGSVVPADVRLDSGSVLIDQSMLTGESIAADAGAADAGAGAFAGALVRRGEAGGHVTATGARTKFGRTAELVRSSKVESSQQRTILAVVRNLALFNGAVTVLPTAYALWLPMPRSDIIPLVLVAVLSSIPVALPAMFTLAAAVGARALARQGVLPTSLSAVDEAAGIDVLCADKTGTLTRNQLAVMAVQALPGFDEAHVLALAGTREFGWRTRPRGCGNWHCRGRTACRRCSGASYILALRSGRQAVRSERYDGRTVRYCGW